jgi:hypothetical protein
MDRRLETRALPLKLSRLTLPSLALVQNSNNSAINKIQR